jgi:hypothetical protein
MTASLWVRYLGGTHYHRADTFVVPTDETPVRAGRLWARGDIAEVWYAYGDRDPNVHREACEELMR